MRVLSAALILALVVAACAPLLAQQKVSDDAIYDQVRKRLASDATVKGGALGVEVKDGAVTLTGKVRSERQKVRAESLTRKIRGVTKVVNKIVVDE